VLLTDTLYLYAITLRGGKHELDRSGLHFRTHSRATRNKGVLLATAWRSQEKDVTSQEGSHGCWLGIPGWDARVATYYRHVRHSNMAPLCIGSTKFLQIIH